MVEAIRKRQHKKIKNEAVLLFFLTIFAFALELSRARTDKFTEFYHKKITIKKL